MAYLAKKTKKLTPAQNKRLSAHSKNHTKKHMTTMRMAMKNGKSFSKAHMEAKKK